METLVFSGGGARGIAYAGVMRALAEHSATRWTGGSKTVKNVHGTSIGAIWGLGVALGFSLQCLEFVAMNLEMEDLLYDMNPAEYLFGSQVSIDSGALLKRWIKSMIAIGLYHDANYDAVVAFCKCFPESTPKFLRADMQRAGHVTFSDILARKGVALWVYTTDELTEESVSFGPGSFGDQLSVVDAVYASAAVPMLFEPVRFTHESRRYALSDGGLTAPLPLSAVDCGFDRTVAFYLTDRTVPKNTMERTFAHLVNRMSALYWEHELSRLQKACTVALPVRTIGPMSLTVSPAARTSAIQSAYDATVRFLRTKDLGARTRQAQHNIHCVPRKMSSDDGLVIGLLLVLIISTTSSSPLFASSSSSSLVSSFVPTPWSLALESAKMPRGGPRGSSSSSSESSRLGGRETLGISPTI